MTGHRINEIIKSGLLTTGLLLAASSSASVQLPAIISDHMVLQQQAPVQLWGWANPGETVTASIGDSSGRTTADEDGNWQVSLPAMDAGGPYELTVSDSEIELRVVDVLVGEVWLGSGQSNMQWPVSRAANAEKEIASSDHNGIRMFTVEHKATATPQTDVNGRWLVAHPDHSGDFSAVGYYFSRHLYQKLDRPVGFIHSSWGGTRVEAWMGRAAFSRPVLASFLSAEEDVKQNREREKASIKSRGSQNEISHLFNAMIAPITTYPIKGVVWYQGERNANRDESDLYHDLFSAMIENWRLNWGRQLPFYFVQLANFRQRELEPPLISKWAEVRDAQRRTLALPNTAMAVIIDIGEADDIHPKNKQEVGRRLALAALARQYGHDIAYSGPLYRNARFDGSDVEISFDYTDGLSTVNDAPLVGFAIAGADRKFVWANARIEGERIVVWSDAVKIPMSVRYGWGVNPETNLTNRSGLPASPFRTDGW